MKNINKHANRDFINNEAVIIVKCSNKCNFLLELLANKERGGVRLNPLKSRTQMLRTHPKEIMIENA